MDISTDFPNCCKACIIFDFPYDYYGYKHTVEEIEQEIKNDINEFIADQAGYFAIMFATLNSHQVKAREALENLGFYGLPEPAENKNGTQIWSFMLPLNEWSHK